MSNKLSKYTNIIIPFVHFSVSKLNHVKNHWKTHKRSQKCKKKKKKLFDQLSFFIFLLLFNWPNKSQPSIKNLLGVIDFHKISFTCLIKRLIWLNLRSSVLMLIWTKLRAAVRVIESLSRIGSVKIFMVKSEKRSRQQNRWFNLSSVSDHASQIKHVNLFMEFTIPIFTILLHDRTENSLSELLSASSDRSGNYCALGFHVTQNQVLDAGSRVELGLEIKKNTSIILYFRKINKTTVFGNLFKIYQIF